MVISVELSAIIGMAVGFTFWLAGLSFRSSQNAKDLARLEGDHKGLGDKIADEMSQFRGEMSQALHSINSSLFRLEGRAEANKDKED